MLWWKASRAVVGCVVCSGLLWFALVQTRRPRLILEPLLAVFPKLPNRADALRDNSGLSEGSWPTPTALHSARRCSTLLHSSPPTSSPPLSVRACACLAQICTCPKSQFHLPPRQTTALCSSPHQHTCHRAARSTSRDGELIHPSHPPPRGMLTTLHDH